MRGYEWCQETRTKIRELLPPRAREREITAHNQTTCFAQCIMEAVASLSNRATLWDEPDFLPQVEIQRLAEALIVLAAVSRGPNHNRYTLRAANAYDAETGTSSRRFIYRHADIGSYEVGYY